MRRCVRSDLGLVSATAIGGRMKGDLVRSVILVGSGAGSVAGRRGKICWLRAGRQVPLCSGCC
jgi:hypothetical protein